MAIFAKRLGDRCGVGREERAGFDTIFIVLPNGPGGRETETRRARNNSPSENARTSSGRGEEFHMGHARELGGGKCGTLDNT